MKAQTDNSVQDQDGNSSKPLLSSRLFMFRAWDSIKKQMLQNNYEVCAVVSAHQRGEKAILYPLMQYTSLFDKYGVKICEGDIVKYTRSIGNWTGQYMTTTHKIIFTEEVNAFVMDYGSSYIKLRKHWGYEYEVIGNIYENPELL